MTARPSGPEAMKLTDSQLEGLILFLIALGGTILWALWHR